MVPSRLGLASLGLGDWFLLGREGWWESGWLWAGDRRDGTSEFLESAGGPLLSDAGAWDKSLEVPCDEDELFCSLSTLFSSPPSLLESLFVSTVESFLSRDGEGEDEEEEELEEDDEEEEDLWDWAAPIGGWTFSLCLFSMTSLCRAVSLSLALSLERDRLLFRCWGAGAWCDLKKEIIKVFFLNN